jgi:hypothetical protein
MTSHLRYDFPVVSNGANQQGAGAEWDEDIKVAIGPGFEGGEKVGTVRLTNEDKDPPKRVTAAFAFDNRDTATYEGKIPGDGSWNGEEKLQKKGGKKKFKDEIKLLSSNPKRWG